MLKAAPEPIKGYQFPNREAPFGRSPVYDWDSLLDGNARRLEQGKHFTVDPVQMAANFRNRAYACNKLAQTHVDGPFVYCQVTRSMTQEEIDRRTRPRLDRRARKRVIEALSEEEKDRLRKLLEASGG